MSADVPVGIPFNIASYALLTHMVAEVVGMGVGDFIHTIGDAHFYIDQLDGVREALTRDPLPLPQLCFTRTHTNIDDFTLDSFVLTGYESHPFIPLPVAK